MKQGNKIGGLLKAIKNTDPFGASLYNIEADVTLANRSDGSIHIQQKVNGKYECKSGDAAEKAMDDGCRQLLKELK